MDHQDLQLDLQLAFLNSTPRLSMKELDSLKHALETIEAPHKLLNWNLSLGWQTLAVFSSKNTLIEPRAEYRCFLNAKLTIVYVLRIVLEPKRLDWNSRCSTILTGAWSEDQIPYEPGAREAMFGLREAARQGKWQVDALMTPLSMCMDEIAYK
jgi:hypothetical protein